MKQILGKDKIIIFYCNKENPATKAILNSNHVSLYSPFDVSFGRLKEDLDNNLCQN